MFTIEKGDNYFFYIFLWKNLEIRQFIRIFAVALGKCTTKIAVYYRKLNKIICLLIK